ncbi:MAG: hypothetical protein IPP66_09555 [Anaerolineales bacterium]|nr:hypothetical protein [Anaerolineales bacterium]
MKRYFFVLISLLLVISACTPQATTTPEAVAPTIEVTPTLAAPTQPASIFDYDTSRPFDVQINSQSEQDGVTITDLSYASHDPGFSVNGRTIAYLVTPKGEGPFAGVVFLHWLGSPNGGRKQFLEEAVNLAQHGVVSLLLQGYYPWMTVTTLDETDRPRILGQIKEISRGVDFLLTQPNVDPQRLGFVGHDYGAVFGGTVAGVDKRVKTYVLIAGVPTLGDFQQVGIKLPDGYLSFIEDLDPVRYVSKASPASIFFQFAKNDQFVSEEMANQFADAASEPKKATWYDDHHQMANETASADRLAWLTEQLGLSVPK